MQNHPTCIPNKPRTIVSELTTWWKGNFWELKQHFVVEVLQKHSWKMQTQEKAKII